MAAPAARADSVVAAAPASSRSTSAACLQRPRSRVHVAARCASVMLEQKRASAPESRSSGNPSRTTAALGAKARRGVKHKDVRQMEMLQHDGSGSDGSDGSDG